MRTTLTLDDDVAVQLEELRRARTQSLKSLVNEALREGLRALAAPSRKPHAFHTGVVDLGRCRLGSLDNVAEVLAIGEGDAFR